MFTSLDAIRVPEPGNVPDEDLGSALVRPPPPPQATEENVTAFHADANTQLHPEEQPSDPVAYSLLHELAQPIGTRPPMWLSVASHAARSFINHIAVSAAPMSTESATGSRPVQPAASAPKRKKAEDDKGKAVKKKKKKRDEIDDIFGF